MDKGLTNKNMSKKIETQQKNLQKYRLVELRDINKDFGTPFWRIHSYHEFEQKWITYGNQDYPDYETAKRCYDIVVGKLPKLKVMKETEVEV
jgi:hypothetical protein